MSQKPRENDHVQNEQLMKVSNFTIVQSRKNCQQKGHVGYDIYRPIPVTHNQITSSSNYNAMNSAQHRRNSAVSINSTKSNEQLTMNYDKTARKRQQRYSTIPIYGKSHPKEMSKPRQRSQTQDGEQTLNNLSVKDFGRLPLMDTLSDTLNKSSKLSGKNIEMGRQILNNKTT